MSSVAAMSTSATSQQEALALLDAPGPHPSLHDPLMLFGQFVGTWDVQVRFFDPTGSMTFDEPGQWSFAWVLDGRMVQDVLVYPNPVRRPDGSPGDRRIGTTLRSYDAASDSWRVVWFGATTGTFVVLRGRRDDEGILIEGQDSDGKLLRWSFRDIGPDRFHWWGHASTDGGATWHVTQDMPARRRASR